MIDKYIYKFHSNILKLDNFHISIIIKYVFGIFFTGKLKNSVKTLILFSSFVISCTQTSPTVNPADIISSYFSTPPGTTLMQVSMAYPTPLAAGIPINTQIVLVFTKNAQDATIAGNVTISGSITGAHAFTTGGADGKVITLTPSVPFSSAVVETVTVTVGTGVISTAADDTRPLDAIYTRTFTTAPASTASYPYALAATRYPVPSSTVSKNLSYVEITFSKPVSGATITTGVGGSFRVSSDGGVTDVGTGKIQIGTSNTWRVNLGALTYGATYTVTLTSAITDGTNPLQSAPVTWTFDIEADPGVGNPTSISNAAVLSVTNSSGVIAFTTNKPAVRANTHVLYGITTALGSDVLESAWDWDGCGDTKHSNHGFNVPGLVHNTLYYYRIWVDVNGDSTQDAGDLYYPTAATSDTFFTRTDTAAGGGGKVLANANNNQNGFKTVQMDDGSSYVFWVDANSSDIKGQYFNSAGSPQWGAGGTAVTNGGSYTNIFAMKSRNSVNNEVILFYRSGTNIYAKMLFNNTGAPAFVWLDPANDATDAGITLANDSLSGSNFTAALGHERPTIRVTGNATMPYNGAPANLFFDKDVDFSTIPWLSSHASDVTQMDHILTNIAGIAWDEYSIQLQTSGPVDIYRFVLYATPSPGSSALNINLGTAYPNYYIVDRDSRLSRTATANTDSTTPPYPVCTNSGTLAGVTTGHIIRADVTGGPLFRYGKVTSAAPYTISLDSCVDVDRSITGLNSGDTFVVYTNISGPPYTSSEAITNPLWDGTKTFITSGVTAGDIVVNENNNTLPATKAVVVGSPVSETALALDADIMNDVDNYAIVTLPAGATYVAVGYSTSAAINKLNDTNAAFISPTPQVGDIVFNIDGNESAEILAINGANQLTLTADVFSAANQKYIIYRKRAFILTYIDTSNDVIAKKFNLADSSSVGATTTVDTGSFTNPHSVSDGAGGAVVSYESSTGVISSAGVRSVASLRWGPLVKTAAGYTVNQMLEDSAASTIGGAYLLDSNSATGIVNIYRISGSDGSTAAGWPVSVTGYSPHASVDKYDLALPSRIILAYLPTHPAGNTYRHVGIASYIGTGGAASFSSNVTASTITTAYNCQFPRVVVSDTDSTTTNEFYITWFDGRYYSSLGYGLYTQRYTAAGAKYVAGNWANEIFIASPTSFGAGSELQLDTLFYITTPGIISIWLDYRNKAVTGTDIYYEGIKADGSFLP